MPVSCSIRSARVDLPWSMCAMMQKLRITAWSVLAGDGRAGTLMDTMLSRACSCLVRLLGGYPGTGYGTGDWFEERPWVRLSFLIAPTYTPPPSRADRCLGRPSRL